MGDERKSAIEFEKTLEKPLGEVTAAEFVAVLNNPKLGGKLHPITDKKKYELWVEEGTIEKIPLGELIEKLKGEKKKAELEFVEYGKRVFREQLTADTYGQLVGDIAARVEQSLGPELMKRIDALKGVIVTDG